ncbi:dTMP kinase [Alicyclobacillaceae bacterium I2511]|nr:dTMP kinase [Alicyclobacillaceae bacterium I2511]
MGEGEIAVLITFEGLDGAGKSTQIQRLRIRLEQAGYPVLWTREPGGTPLGDMLRSLLLSSSGGPVAAKTEALLYAASRAQLLEQVIQPALTQNKIVLCDRFVDASIAYQGAGLGLGISAVEHLNDWVLGGIKPQLTLLFDLPVQVSRQRVRHSRGEGAADRIEQRDNEYFERVRRALLDLARRHPQRIHVVDATWGLDAVEQEIWHVVEKSLV